ncbi:MAG: hypothetical protein FJ290_17650 [Planctomycetes bacterium]|nr:hypothetical protein [Planctomycetota bacterium]
MARQSGHARPTPKAGKTGKTGETQGVVVRAGGYFCGPDQGMPFPPARSEAFRQALERYGRYPLERP